MIDEVSDAPPSANGHISIVDVRAMFDKAAQAPRRIEQVTVPLFGTVYVRGLRSTEYDEFEAACVSEDGKSSKANRPLLVRHCVVTPDGQKVFRDDHIEMLAGLDAGIINPIAKKAMELCGLGKEETEAIEKN